MTSVPIPNIDSRPPTTSGFEDDVRRTVTCLQGATAAVIESLPSFSRTSQELAAQLGIDKNLAWKVFRLMAERDRLAAGRFVLGSQAMGIFVRAAGERGAAPEALEELRVAAAEFEEVVRVHAGDRASIEMMLSGAGERPDEPTEIAQRRAAFRANGYFVGVQVRAQLQTFIAAPSRTEGMLDGVSLRSLVELRRLRAAAPVVIGRALCTDQGGVLLHPGGLETLDDAFKPGEMPLIREFSSQPLPAFRRVMGMPGFVEDVLAEGSVGNTGAITVTSGEVMRAVSQRTRRPGDETVKMVTRVKTPCEVLVSDYIVHKDLFGPLTPGLDVYCDMMGEAMRRVDDRERYRRPVGETVEHLGRGLEAAQASDIPRYSKLLRYVFDRLGWDGTAFDVYRVRMEFPFTPSSVVIVHPMPE